MTEFTTTTVETVLNIGVDAITDNIELLMPVVIPVAVALAFLFGVLYFFFGSARRK